jgi:hypothetical protein
MTVRDRLLISSAAIALVGISASARIAAAQGLSLRPQIGFYIPTDDMIAVSQGGSVGKIEAGPSFGLALGLRFGSRFGIEASGAYVPTTFSLGAAGAVNEQDARLFLGNALAVLHLLPATSPISFSLNGGVGVISRGGVAFTSDAKTSDLAGVRVPWRAVGAVATITASYPAARLTTKERWPGVVLQTTATFTLAAEKGAVNPPSCSTAPVTIAGGIPISAVPSAPATKTPTVPSVTRAPAGGGAGAPLTPAPPGAPAPSAPAVGAAPTGVAVSGTPLIASVTWTASPNATRYAVWRKDGAQLSVERSPPGLTATRFTDTVPDPRPTYLYTVIAHYADGTSGEAPAVQYVSPPLLNPTGFTVALKGQTTSAQADVEVSWNPVTGAVQYRLDGPGLPGTGQHSGTTTVAATIPRGAGSWKVTALYPGNFADYPSATTVSKVIRILPTPSQPWLTKSNGPGSQDDVQMPREGKKHCVSFFPCTYEVVLPNQVQHPYDAGTASWLGIREYNTNGLGRIGLAVWLDMDLDAGFKFWDDPLQYQQEAVYGNPGDLGVGRRSFCAQKTRTGLLPGVYTVCYASAHGIAPGEPGFNDPLVISNPGPGRDPGLLLTMVIAQEPTGSVFLVISPEQKFNPGATAPYQVYTLAPTVTLDTQGEKYLPHACLSCHGGTYNPVTHKVDGASFLPIDPDLQLFSSPAEKSAQQFKIRRINEIISKSGSSPAVVAYINGLYGNAVSIPHQPATPDYVPAGWQAQAGLYRQVVRPYCAMCHLAAESGLSFASWANFQSNAVRIKAAVCGAHTMPHSELQFKEFWLKDTGPLYLPGMMAASLGFSSC